MDYEIGRSRFSSSVSSTCLQSNVALVHGSELGTDPPSPRARSLDAVAVRHAETGHRIEDLARQLYLSSLPIQGSTSHTSADDGSARGA